MPARRLFEPILPAALALGLLLAATGPAAADTARRLTIDIELRRDGAVQSGVEHGRDRLEQKLSLSAILHSDGSPGPSNPLDPQDGQRQLEQAERAQQRMRAAQVAYGGAAATMPDAAALQARAQQLMARCGQDRECLMREASALSAAATPGADRATPARLQAYGQATARRRAGGGEDEPDDAVETPYLLFFGRPGCRLETAVKIDGRVEGSFQDVPGTVPYTETAQAQHTRRDDTLCALLQAVLDQRSGRLWTHVMVVDAAPGVQVRSEKGHQPRRSEGTVLLRWLEAEKWVQQRLTRLGASGEDHVQLPAEGGGRVEVVMRWRFDAR